MGVNLAISLNKVKILAPLSGLAAYMVWIAAFKMLFLTLAVYLFVSAHPGASGFDEIHDWVSSNELTLMAVSSLLFVLVLRSSSPSRTATWEEFVHSERWIKRFLPGFVNGSLIAGVLILAFIAAGLYRFLGLLLQPEEASLTLVQFFAKTLSCIALAYCEAYLFNQRWLSRFRGFAQHDWIVVGIIGVAYCLVKMIQFELSWTQVFTLLLIQILISSRKIIDGDFGFGAGFLSGLWFIFHPVFSLSILGNSVSGLWMIRPVALAGFQKNGPDGLPVESAVLCPAWCFN